MFKWKKKGQIWSPSLSNLWAKEYGQNPNAIVLKDRIRIYFSSRKKNECEKAGGYISYIFYIDVDKDDPSKVLFEQDTPILHSAGKGLSDEFDEFGTMPGSFLQLPDQNEVWLYYVGWTRDKTYPYKWANGLVVSTNDGASFDQPNKKQILTSGYKSPYLHACPRVYRFDENNWMMWYASGVEWYDYDNRLNPIYVIKNAKSNDGINWDLDDQQTIPSVGKKECQSSANVFEKDGLFHMFFSYRDLLGDSQETIQYRIGYAQSEDRVNWTRDDSKAGLNVSSSGWDSEAVCYPHVVDVEDKTYIFYSGNQYGCAGFGYAELEEYRA